VDLPARVRLGPALLGLATPALRPVRDPGAGSPDRHLAITEPRHLTLRSTPLGSDGRSWFRSELGIFWSGAALLFDAPPFREHFS
jgi:hypothetical protein